MTRTNSDRLLAALDSVAQDHKPKRLNAPAVMLALESAVDRVLGRAGAGREASAKGHDFLARVALLTEALTGAPATRPVAPPPPPAAHTPKPPAAAAPAQPAAAAWPILERYETLLRTTPRAAGTYYSENADAIAAQTSARNVEFRRQSQAQKRR